jgi:hypothetical protein
MLVMWVKIIIKTALEVWLYSNGVLLKEKNVGFNIKGEMNEIQAFFKDECNCL